MDKQRWIRGVVLVAVLGVFGTGGIALAIDENEPNQFIASAQKLNITGGGVTVNGFIGDRLAPPTSIIPDVDFYTFEGTEGMVLTFDINDGWGGASSVDTILAVFGPGGTYTMLRQNDDCDGIEFDSCIIGFVVPKNDTCTLCTYTVAVSSTPCYLTNGGGFQSGRSSCLPDYNGDYTLVISVVSSPAAQINIEIKPGSRALTSPNPKAKGTIPVALLSSPDFNALDVDVASLTFGRSGIEQSLSRCRKEGQDVNGDGLLDLVCHFENQLAHFELGDIEGVVKGRTNDNRQFEGHGLLKVVPVKRQH